MTTFFHLHQKSDDMIVLRRPDDDFVLVDQAFFKIVSVEMIKPPRQKPVVSTDPDYPFVESIEKLDSAIDADQAFKLHAPKLKAGAQFHHRVYMVRWTGEPSPGGPHFRIDP
jgi:hypothetical protein